MKRGIITSPFQIELNGESSFTVDGQISPTDIRFLVMYWDHIAVPTNNIVGCDLPDEIDLRASGVVTRPQVVAAGDFYGHDIAKTIIHGQYLVAQNLMKDKDIDWVIHSLGSKSVALNEFSTLEPCIRLDLSNALPAPYENVPINEILEFKFRRADELNILHETLDEIYLEILKSPDVALAHRKGVDRLKKDIDALQRVSREKFKVTTSSKFSCNFNFNPAKIFGALTLEQIATFLNGSFPLNALSMALISMIEIKIDNSAVIDLAAKSSKLSYLTSAKSQGVLYTR